MSARSRMKQIGEQVKRDTAQRLRRGIGVFGQRLAPKRRADGTQLGGSLDRKILEGSVIARDDGVEIDYKDQVLEYFNFGTRFQVQRRVLGFTRRDRLRIGKALIEETIKAKARGLFKRKR